jgi:superfamily II DNA helicase RecQ
MQNLLTSSRIFGFLVSLDRARNLKRLVVDDSPSFLVLVHDFRSKHEQFSLIRRILPNLAIMSLKATA